MNSIKLYLIITLIIALSFNNAKSQSWQNKWFSMDIPPNWRTPTMDYNNHPPNKYKDSNIMSYKDVRFISSSNTNSSNIVVETFVDTKGEKLIYKNFIRKDSITIKESITNLNGMVCLKRQVVLKVIDNEKIINHYCSIWYIQGKNRIYIISFGAFNNQVYEENLPIVDKCIISFKEN